MTLTPDVPAIACGRCLYWLPFTDTAGECRRHPPVVDFVDGSPESAWPATFATDWCGEFRPDPDPAPSVAVQPRPGDQP
jgi:hypothetical protein